MVCILWALIPTNECVSVCLPVQSPTTLRWMPKVSLLSVGHCVEAEGGRWVTVTAHVTRPGYTHSIKHMYSSRCTEWAHSWMDSPTTNTHTAFLLADSITSLRGLSALCQSDSLPSSSKLHNTPGTGMHAVRVCTKSSAGSFSTWLCLDYV